MSFLGHTETDKDRIGNFDENVVNAVNMEVFNRTSLEIIDDLTLMEGRVEPTVAICLYQ